ncbi:MAG: nucleoside 2-deoxyribosyltransferase [Candidatus Marinimicrobia bacterium]|nr:nucleoside 2-deoxyribosyltransferase [Candidatus Neomarinimicrobiota bacterium]
MKIYFAGSIRGGRNDKELYLKLIQHLSTYGQVLTEHVGDINLTEFGEDGPSDKWIFDRDISWIEEADILIAEVSTPSLGVGYELAKAELLGKKILCLYRNQKNKRLSAMINGNQYMIVKNYFSIIEAKKQIDEFFTGLD